jgi:Zn-dependent peptidase ImmA (M78 family)/transcriptional regulator with XRE-family HTH domain
MTVALRNVADALRAARRHARLSQTAVARFLGSTRQTVAAFERGERQPTMAHALKLANLYRVPLDELASLRTPAKSVPDFHPRFEGERDLSSGDKYELESFHSYLVTRPPSKVDAVTRARRESIADAAKRVLDESGIDAPPVPIEAIVARAGIEVRFAPLDELAGALLLPESQNEAHGILVNSDQPRERERFTLAHEYGHLILGHPVEPKSGNAFVDHIGRRFVPVEVQADMFAADLLMPVDMLKRWLDSLPPGESLELAVYRLASGFFVSFQAMTARLEKLGVLTPEEVELLRKTKPSQLAKRLGGALRKGKPLSVKSLTTLLESLPTDSSLPTRDTLRLYQDAALAFYAKNVPETERAETPAAVFEKVAVWVADKYPLYAA